MSLNLSPNKFYLLNIVSAQKRAKRLVRKNVGLSVSKIKFSGNLLKLKKLKVCIKERIVGSDSIVESLFLNKQVKENKLNNRLNENLQESCDMNTTNFDRFLYLYYALIYKHRKKNKKYKSTLTKKTNERFFDILLSKKIAKGKLVYNMPKFRKNYQFKPIGKRHFKARLPRRIALSGVHYLKRISCLRFYRLVFFWSLLLFKNVHYYLTIATWNLWFSLLCDFVMPINTDQYFNKFDKFYFKMDVINLITVNVSKRFFIEVNIFDESIYKSFSGAITQSLRDGDSYPIVYFNFSKKTRYHFIVEPFLFWGRRLPRKSGIKYIH